MSLDDLKALVYQQEDAGMTTVVLKVPKKRGPYGNTCSLLPGLNGVCCAYDGTHAVVMVDIAKLRRWLEKRGVDLSKEGR